MKKTLRLFSVFLLSLLLVEPGGAVESNENISEKPVVGAAVITCKGLIDDGLYRSIRRRSKTAIDNGADYLVYEISTYGGLLKSADDISKYLIQDVAGQAKTVAYVTTEAISAGAMISVSCQDIIMRQSTTIGDCAPIVMGGTLEGVEREKSESFTRAAFMRAAEANHYPKALLKAMVTMQTEVYRVQNLQTRQDEFFEADQLPRDANQYDLDNAGRVVPSDELLTLTAIQAQEYGVARAVVDDLQGALDFLAERDGVVFEGLPMMLETTWSEEMARWLNSPAVMAVLVMLALLGVYLELSSPGLGLPGLVAVICFAIILGSKYLDGLANWLEVLLVLAGIVLLLVEIFVLPGFGVAGLTGILCLFAGFFGMLVDNPPDEVPWPETALDWRVFLEGGLGVGLGFIGALAGIALMMRYLPKSRFFKGLSLSPALASHTRSMEVSMTEPAFSRIGMLRVGDVGVVTSPLRPAGRVRFNDSIVDVIAEGDFLDKGTPVVIINIKGNRVVVKKE